MALNEFLNEFITEIDEQLLKSKSIHDGFVGIIPIDPTGEIVCQNEIDEEHPKRFSRFTGGRKDPVDGDLSAVNSQKEFLEIAKATAAREFQEETGVDIDPSRLRLVGFSMGDDEKNPQNGKVYMRTFFSYRFLLREKLPGSKWSSIDNGKKVEYQFHRFSVKDSRANLDGIRLSNLHFAALIAFLRGSH